MKVSLRALSDFFPTLTPSPREFLESKSAWIREHLPLGGLEIGSYKRLDEGLEKVCVALIEKAEKHPQADRLKVCQVRFDEKQNPIQIVCGAPNAREGLKVCLSQIGAKLPNGMEIKKGAIRGVESFGMLCSAAELGLSEESQGIIELANSAPIGAPVATVLGLKDEVWEVELTPDRADCLSWYGLAREVGRWIGQKPSFPQIEEFAINSQDVALVHVENQAKKACLLYTAQLFDVTYHPSPEWLQRKLATIGHRTHGAIVDITNLVMMELGQPMHAFDADKVEGSKVIIRFARDGEKIILLDGVERSLTSEDLVIADLHKPLALAGVMGGLESSVTEKTTRVLLESALFDPITVRKTVQRHKIHTDSSHRFERGVDPQMVLKAVGRASVFFKQLCEARRRGAWVVEDTERSEKMLKPLQLPFDLREFHALIGLEATAEEVKNSFSGVGIDSEIKSPNVLRVTVPTWRVDLHREVDLIEEAARLLGYSKIPERFPAQMQATKSFTRIQYKSREWLRLRALELGFVQMTPYSFVSEKQLAAVPQLKPVELENPLSQDWRFMRPNLAFGLLEVVSRHATKGHLSGSFFDSGAVFSSREALKDQPRDTGVQEDFHLGFAMMGPRNEEHWSLDKAFSQRKDHVDYFDLKGTFECLFGQMSVFEPRFRAMEFMRLDQISLEDQKSSNLSWIPFALLHPYRSAVCYWPGKNPLENVVAYLGEMHPDLKGDYLNLPAKLALGVVFGEVRANVIDKQSPQGQMQLGRNFPLVSRDFAWVVSDAVSAGEMLKVLRKSVGPELLSVDLMDRYVLPDNQVSFAFRFVLQGVTATLEEDQIQALVNKISETAKTKFQATLRS